MRYFILFTLISTLAFSNISALKNGAPLICEIDRSLPRELLVITFTGGAGIVPKELQGIDWIITELLKDGGKNLSKDAFRKRLFLLNSEINYSRTARAMNVFIKTPEQNLRQILTIFSDLIKNPNFTLENFNKVKEQILGSRAMLDNEMRSVTFYLAPRDLFKYHPDTLDGTGSINSIKNITFEKLKEYYDRIFNFEHTFFSALGNARDNFVRNEINRTLFKKTHMKYTSYSFNDIKPNEYGRKGLKATIINKTKAVDNQIFFYYPLDVRMDTKKFMTGIVTHQILGGGLNGKLGSTLRGERGLTYHASSNISQRFPVWYVYTFGGLTQTLPLLNGIREVINNFKKEEISNESYTRAVNAIITDRKAELELPEDILLEKIDLKLKNLDTTFLIENFIQNLKSVTISDIQEFKKTNLDFENGFIYLMGDKDKLKNILKEFGIEEKSITIVEISQVM